MATPPNRDLPEVVSELIIEMHEVRSELNAVNGQLDRLNDRVDRLERTVEKGFQLMREESRQNTDRLVEAFSRSMGQHLSYIERHDAQLKDQERRLNRLENPEA